MAGKAGICWTAATSAAQILLYRVKRDIPVIASARAGPGSRVGAEPGSIPILGRLGSLRTRLWPAPEDHDADLNACQEPQWLDSLAAAARHRLRSHAGDPVIGHGDWHPENLSWQGPHLIAVHDWDSAICQPEPAIAGLAAASFHAGPPDCGNACSTPRPDPSTAIPGGS